MLTAANRLVLMDYGLVLPEFDRVEVRPPAGSPDYMAPEVIRGEVGSGAGKLVDLYAVGMVGYEMLAGRPAFEANDFSETLRRQLAEPPPSLRQIRPDAPELLVQLVEGLLEKDPSERPQDAEEVLWRLRSPELRFQAEAEGLDESFSVLVVDDEPEMREAVAVFAQLALPRANVAVAADAESALATVRRGMPDVLLLDLQLPGMSGLELALYLRGTHAADRCAIVAVSGRASESDVQLLAHLGIERFVGKGADLQRTIAATLHEVRAARARKKSRVSP
jgi:CheY-like chemotaxis protein